MRIVETAEALYIGPRDVMQDIVVQAPITQGPRFLGVIDGHGENGDYVADLARSVLLETAAAQEDLVSARAGASDVSGALRTLHARLEADPKAQRSGATAAVAVFKDSALSIPLLGDGGAIYIPDEGPTQVLTEPHTTDNEREVKRLEGLDPPVYVETIDEAQRFDGYSTISRSIGDHAERFIIGTAETSHHVIRSAGILALGTDGLLGRSIDRYERVASAIRTNQHLGLQDLAQQLVYDFGRCNSDNAGTIVARIA